MCGYSWTTAPKCEYCPECCQEMDKIEDEQPNCMRAQCVDPLHDMIKTITNITFMPTFHTYKNVAIQCMSKHIVDNNTSIFYIT
jgi:hypothetical protein